MGFFELFFIALGLSADAFSVSVCKGLGMPRSNLKSAVIVGLYFGGFQALMPLIGWLLGGQFERYIAPVSHWVAFFLLAFIGGKMVAESFRKGEDACPASPPSLNWKEMLVLAVATSIDALATGVTFAFFQVAILPAALLIGAITFLTSFAGVQIGCKCGLWLKSKAELAGGLVLIGIGVKILLEHLFS